MMSSHDLQDTFTVFEAMKQRASSSLLRALKRAEIVVAEAHVEELKAQEAKAAAQADGDKGTQAAQLLQSATDGDSDDALNGATDAAALNGQKDDQDKRQGSPAADSVHGEGIGAAAAPAAPRARFSKVQTGLIKAEIQRAQHEKSRKVVADLMKIPELQDFTKEQLVRKVKDLRAKAKEQAAGAAAAAAQANTPEADDQPQDEPAVQHQAHTTPHAHTQLPPTPHTQPSSNPIKSEPPISTTRPSKKQRTVVYVPATPIPANPLLFKRSNDTTATTAISTDIHTVGPSKPTTRPNPGADTSKGGVSHRVQPAQSSKQAQGGTGSHYTFPDSDCSDPDTSESESESEGVKEPAPPQREGKGSGKRESSLAKHM